MNVRIRRTAVASTLILVGVSAACAVRVDDEREAQVTSAMRNVGPGGGPGPSDPPDPVDPPNHGGGGGGVHLRDSGVDSSLATPSDDAGSAAPSECATRRYFVWLANVHATCNDIEVDGAAWVGEPIFPGHVSNHCAYRWTGPSLPDSSALDALEAVALPLHDRPVVPDCTALPSGCAAGDPSCSTAPPSIKPGFCPKNGKVVQDGGCVPVGMVSCDCCAVAEGDTLYAVISPDLVSAPTLSGQDESFTTKVTLTPPPGAQRFAIPVPPGTFSDGTIVTLGVPQQ